MGTDLAVVAALVPCLSSLVPGGMEPVPACSLCAGGATSGGAVARSWVLLPCSALRATVLLLEGEVAPFMGLLTIELGRFPTVSPNTEGELGVICLLLFRLPVSNNCSIIMFPSGITKLKFAGWSLDICCLCCCR